jgi:hypothetical protein
MARFGGPSFKQSSADSGPASLTGVNFRVLSPIQWRQLTGVMANKNS